MDDHRTVSVSRIYVPNEYTVYLSPPDREQFADYEDSLQAELQDYLAEHARREGYVLLTPPEAADETDADLALGEFGIATRMVQRDRSTAIRREPGAAGSSPERRWSTGRRTPLPPDGPPADVALAQEIVTLTMDGVRHEVDKRRIVLGRSKDCDIQLADPNVSRRHAELRQEGVGVLARRPRLDERLAGERPAHRAREARERRRDHDRLDRARLRAEARRSDALGSRRGRRGAAAS